MTQNAQHHDNARHWAAESGNTGEDNWHARWRRLLTWAKAGGPGRKVAAALTALGVAGLAVVVLGPVIAVIGMALLVSAVAGIVGPAMARDGDSSDSNSEQETDAAGSRWGHNGYGMYLGDSDFIRTDAARHEDQVD